MAIAQRIGEAGPIGFDDFVAHALYAPDLGFYTGGRGAGRRRDFLTSPEVGPLFGLVMARALDAWWIELGRPDPYVVVEAGAGPGTLARSILAATPACAAALRLVLVEPADVQWSSHPARVESRIDLPAPGELGAGPVVVLANELLDNLPFALVERTSDGWAEVRVGWDADPGSIVGPADAPDRLSGARSADGRFVEVLQPLDEARARWCDERIGGPSALGARLPVQAEAAAWVAEARALASGGRVVALDYASTSLDLGGRHWLDWVRTYAGHGRAGHPLEAPGTCDITCEVAVDQLALAAPPDADRDQATFLRAHGLDELVAEGARTWAARGDRTDLAAIAGRSRVHEAAALTDPAGLGAFRVLEWVG
ncbi:MAG: hypothetical protein JWN46_1785 [Acidimicrobiales bacterium]|nr:hypothetical protein [Acidimicrobiales bacterium]